MVGWPQWTTLPRKPGGRSVGRGPKVGPIGGGERSEARPKVGPIGGGERSEARPKVGPIGGGERSEARPKGFEPLTFGSVVRCSIR